MSIASRMKTVELQVSTKVKDERSGKLKDTFSYLTNVDVDITFSNMSKIPDIEKYKDCEYMGTTAYNTFDLSKAYRIIDGSMIYDIASINQFARYTQLIMRAVVKDG